MTLRIEIMTDLSREQAIKSIEDKAIIDPETGCLEYQGELRNGYGRLGTNSRANRLANTRSAHRATWILYRRCTPVDLEVRHKCDNPRCVNINHLEIGTREDNAADRMKTPSQMFDAALINRFRKYAAKCEALLNEQIRRRVELIFDKTTVDS